MLENPKTPLHIRPNLTTLSRAMFSMPYACGGLSGVRATLRRDFEFRTHRTFLVRNFLVVPLVNSCVHLSLPFRLEFFFPEPARSSDSVRRQHEARADGSYPAGNLIHSLLVPPGALPIKLNGFPFLRKKEIVVYHKLFVCKIRNNDLSYFFP